MHVHHDIIVFLLSPSFFPNEIECSHHDPRALKVKLRVIQRLLIFHFRSEVNKSDLSHFICRRVV